MEMMQSPRQTLLEPKKVMTIQLLNYGPEFGKPFKAQEMCELH